MSWFTKKKDPEDDKKESSPITIETMNADLENTSKEGAGAKKKEEGKKSIKKSPFLVGKEKVEKDSVSVKKNLKEGEKDTPNKKEEVVTKAPVAVEDKLNKMDIEKVEEVKIGTSTEKVDLEEKLPKSPKDEGETLEDKMEKIVKNSKKKPAKITPKEPVSVPEDSLTKEPLEEENESKTEDKAEEEVKNKKSKGKDFFKPLRKKEKKVASVLPAKQSSRSLTKTPTMKSPFGVPRKGVSVADKTKKKAVEKRVNKPLLILAVIVFVLTLLAIGYNYYRNSKKEPSIKTTPMVIEPEPIEPAYKTDNFADSAIILQTSKELLLTDLKEFTKKEKVSDPNKFLDGQFIRPLQNETEYIAGIEVLKVFNSEDSSLNGFLADPVIIFITQEPTNAKAREAVISPALSTEEVLKEETKVAEGEIAAEEVKEVISDETVNKLSLMLELKEGSDPSAVIERLIEIETIFPGTLQSLMLFEDVTLVNEKIIFNEAAIVGRENLVHAVRYFNFESGDLTKSLEWGLLEYKNKSYIFFTTSKASTDSLIKALY